MYELYCSSSVPKILFAVPFGVHMMHQNVQSPLVQYRSVHNRSALEGFCKLGRSTLEPTHCQRARSSSREVLAPLKMQGK